MMSDLDSLFGSIFGLFFKSVELIIGSCIFAITKGEQKFTFGKNLTFYGYIAVLTFDNFIPSYLGHEIYATTCDFSEDLLSSEWIEADLRYKKVMVIFLENLKKPIKMSVMWFENLDLERFREVSSDYLYLSFRINK